MRQDNRYDRPSGGRDDRRSGGGRSFGNRSFGGGRDNSDRTMHQAVCDECGQDCEVPFKPSSGKPIYCNACFSKSKGRDGARDSGRSEQRFDSRPSFDSNHSTNNNQSKLQLDSINMKLDQILKILKSVPEPKSEIKAKEVKAEAIKKVVEKPAKKVAKKK